LNLLNGEQVNNKEIATQNKSLENMIVTEAFTALETNNKSEALQP